MSTKKIIVSSAIGSILEWFDFAVYGYVAPYIAELFFPSENKIVSLLLTYSVFAVGFIIRPLSAVFFGYIGDRFGRKNALVYSSLLMAIPTFMLGLLPTYHEIGIGAPLLLILCRLIQGLAIGGEFTGSFIYLYEHALPHRKAASSCIADIGCSFGMLLGLSTVAILHTVLTQSEFYHFGWRIPFLSGLFLALIGVYIRTYLPETVEFVARKSKIINPTKIIFQENKMKLLTTILFLTMFSIGFYILSVFIPNQMITLGTISASKAYIVSILVLSVKILSIFYSAKRSDSVARWKIIAVAQLACFLLAYPVFYSLSHLSLTIQFILLCLFAISLGCCFGPRASFLAEIYPVSIRYSAIAIALNIVTAIFGGTTPFLATYLIAKTGISEAPALLIILSTVVGFFSLISLVTNVEQKEISLSAES